MKEGWYRDGLFLRFLVLLTRETAYDRRRKPTSLR